jgi:hypothetical protein
MCSVAAGSLIITTVTTLMHSWSEIGEGFLEKMAFQFVLIHEGWKGGYL